RAPETVEIAPCKVNHDPAYSRHYARATHQASEVSSNNLSSRGPQRRTRVGGQEVREGHRLLRLHRCFWNPIRHDVVVNLFVRRNLDELDSPLPPVAERL